MMNSQKLQDWQVSSYPPSLTQNHRRFCGLCHFFGVVGLASVPTQALTLRTGEVLVCDDTVHLGASPENRARGN